MNETDGATEGVDKPELYEIRLKGLLDQRWLNWFEGMTIIIEEKGETLLVGPIADQTALHGLIKRIRDLGMPLLSVLQVDPAKGSCRKLRPTTIIRQSIQTDEHQSYDHTQSRKQFKE